eukprot:GHUV01055992.1.p2 GENE.GHUV01055992.1~~GHUV01055992.1.p2  ORF type:complete len:102 (-),score=18.60 GHUV01055992.1:47-352(-)
MQSLLTTFGAYGAITGCKASLRPTQQLSQPCPLVVSPHSIAGQNRQHASAIVSFTVVSTAESDVCLQAYWQIAREHGLSKNGYDACRSSHTSPAGQQGVHQ